MMPDGTTVSVSSTDVTNGARAVALVVTLLGAVSFMGSSGGGMSSEYAVALRDGLLKVGLAGGLMKAGATAAAKAGGPGTVSNAETGEDDNRRDANSAMGHHSMASQMRETAEQITRMLQSHFLRVPHPNWKAASHLDSGQNDSTTPAFRSSIAARLYNAFAASHAPTPTTDPEEYMGETDLVHSATPNSGAKSTSASDHPSDVPPQRRRHRDL